MLQHDVAKKLYEEIKEKASQTSIKGFDELYQDFLKDAVSYAQTRTSWSFLNLESRRANDVSRSIKHDAYMSMLTAVCRNLGIADIDSIMPERKTKGDFACYIALFLALEQR